MKYKCKNCGFIFDSLDNLRCPRCNKAVEIAKCGDCSSCSKGCKINIKPKKSKN